MSPEPDSASSSRVERRPLWKFSVGCGTLIGVAFAIAFVGLNLAMHRISMHEAARYAVVFVGGGLLGGVIDVMTTPFGSGSRWREWASVWLMFMPFGLGFAWIASKGNLAVTMLASSVWCTLMATAATFRQRKVDVSRVRRE